MVQEAIARSYCPADDRLIKINNHAALFRQKEIFIRHTPRKLAAPREYNPGMSRYNIINYSAVTRTILAFGQSLRSPSICNQSVTIKRSSAGIRSENTKYRYTTRCTSHPFGAYPASSWSHFFRDFSNLAIKYVWHVTRNSMLNVLPLRPPRPKDLWNAKGEKRKLYVKRSWVSSSPLPVSMSKHEDHFFRSAIRPRDTRQFSVRVA